MSEEELIDKLHQVFLSLGIGCRRTEGDFQGGVYRLKNHRYLVLNSNLLPSQEIDLLCRELARFDLSEIYLLPALRREIETRSGRKAPLHGSRIGV